MNPNISNKLSIRNKNELDKSDYRKFRKQIFTIFKEKIKNIKCHQELDDVFNAFILKSTEYIKFNTEKDKIQKELKQVQFQLPPKELDEDIDDLFIKTKTEVITIEDAFGMKKKEDDKIIIIRK